ncbi:hypothetical protein RRG08_047587 [Elysia crispata]|uniref:Uncharacterized protein n=1 Tax=Elysia crispata TaxID=231223 RepID=A0AAE0XNM9_9GAST|nr:hypothetical protein RRG08_047587 [Elysia crispata]
MKVAHNATYMGMWQFLAAANVIGSPIFSVYPDSGSEVYRIFFTRKLLPRNVTSSHTVTLLWSATIEHSNMMPKANWTANHVVPMMGLGDLVEIDSDQI